MLRWIAVFVLAFACPLAARAAGFEVPVQGSQSLRLAVAEPQNRGLDPVAAAALRSVVERDLAMTGYFELVGTAAHLERGKGSEPGEFAFEDWSSIRVAALAKLRLTPPGGDCDPARVCLDVFVYDVFGREKLAAKRLRAGPGETTALAHQAANAILLALVGEVGFFGETVAAVSERSGNKEIVTVPLGGGPVVPQTRNGSLNLSPAWDSTRSRLAWTSFRKGNADVWTKDLRSGQVLLASGSAGLDISPAFSPDGRTMAVARSEAGDTDIFLVDALTGKVLRQLTDTPGIDVSPHFSPDGRRLVFSSERSGGSQIYEIPVEGGTARRVTTMAGFFTDPVYSPDGGRVAFVSRTPGGFDVLTVGLDGTGPVRITQDQGDNEDPTWSPDGRYLVFSSTRDGRRRLWISTANGRHHAPVSDDTGLSQPTWTR